MREALPIGAFHRFNETLQSIHCALPDENRYTLVPEVLYSAGFGFFEKSDFRLSKSSTLTP